MEKYSKAIGAAVGGAAAGGGLGLMLPDGSPWYAYVLMTLITTALPALMTYLAKANTQ